MTSPNKAYARHLILEAAQKQFAHFGFFKARMDEIAEDAGFGKASLYYYFPTKENLFQSVVLQEQEEFIRNVVLILDKEVPAGDKLRAYVRYRFEYFNKLMNLNILDLRSSAKIKPMMKTMFEDLSDRELKFIRQIMLEGKRNGEFDIRSAEKIAEAFLHTMRGLRLCRIRASQGPRVGEPETRALKEEIGLVTDIFLRGMCKARFAASRN